MQDDSIRQAFVIHGRVQGVFFRASTREQAEALGLSGWVRNAVDGTVHAEVEGPRAGVDQLRAWFEAGGPPAARVDRVVVQAAALQGARGFVVLR